jgi:hypothetical protein
LMTCGFFKSSDIPHSTVVAEVSVPPATRSYNINEQKQNLV